MTHMYPYTNQCLHNSLFICQKKRDSPGVCRRCPIGRHICVLIQLNPHTMSNLSIQNKSSKGFPCFRPYMAHWMTLLSPHVTEFLHNCQFIYTKQISKCISLFYFISDPLVNTSVSSQKSPPPPQWRNFPSFLKISFNNLMHHIYQSIC